MTRFCHSLVHVLVCTSYVLVLGFWGTSGVWDIHPEGGGNIARRGVGIPPPPRGAAEGYSMVLQLMDV
jgi:hypothetical protein